MKKTIKDFDLRNKKVIIRCDFNVPIEDNKIVDETRVIESLPTIKYAVENNAKVILMSHLGKVKTIEDKKTKSLRLVSELLKKYLSDVTFVDDTKGSFLEDVITSMKGGQVILIENTRFEDLEGKKEISCDLELSKYWASLGDIFINDAFGTIHRRHASNFGISKYLKSGIGFLVEKELVNLEGLNKAKRPFVVVMGGAKISDKLKVINNLVEKCDYLLIGGGMSYTFLKAKGLNIGNSICEEEMLENCKNLLEKYKDKIILPIDNVVTKEFKSDAKKYNVTNIEDGYEGMDIGDETIKLFSKYLKEAKTVFWNGPVGVYEFPRFRNGSESLLKTIVSTDSVSILGGGDMVACANSLNLADKVSFISTGGGATLTYLSGDVLPGLENICDK